MAAQLTKEEIEDLITYRLKGINGAFVLGDDGQPDFFGHHIDHKARMEAAKAEKDFWDAAKKELMKHGVSSLVAVLKVVLVLALAGISLKLGMVKLP